MIDAVAVTERLLRRGRRWLARQRDESTRRPSFWRGFSSGVAAGCVVVALLQLLIETVQ